MWIDSPENSDLLEVFAIAEGGPVSAATPELLTAITSGGRRRRRISRTAIAAPLALASAGIIVGAVALGTASPHHTNRLSVSPAASSKPVASAQPAAACDQAGAQHYLVAAEVPPNLADRKDAVPTAAVPIYLTLPGATAADPGLTFEVACTTSGPGSGTSVDINGATGTISHNGTTSTVSWSPQAGYLVSYISFGGTNGPIADSVLVAMARAVPTAS